ncbi:MAG TPA: hypothetical protein VMA34_14855 [Terracidiphilus sp.]|nr:hypothetical protein [Terracidiphilus sp.]
MHLQPGGGLSIAAIVLLAASGAWADGADTPVAAHLDAPQIVARMEAHTRTQNQQLKQYRSLRVYQVEYRGYHARIAARMEVEVRFDAGSGKSFRIVSESGSPFLLNKVLKRAVAGEEEASHDGASTALNPENYRFTLLGVDEQQGRPAYVLQVEPVKPAKFLYRGRIWVDAQEFAVTKIDAEPAKSPSIWISRTTIRNTSEVTDGFWLPSQTESRTWVRIGGTADLTIDYGTYQVTPADPQPEAAASGGL